MRASPPAALPAPPIRRLVVDTNVVLDLVVFRDASAAPIARALREGRAECLTNAACLAELRTVLGRPQFGLDATALARALAEYAALAQRAADAQGRAAPLPRCRDPDDQKFLELARDAGADCLVTRDRALLRLRRARHHLGAFLILTPAELAPRLAWSEPTTGEAAATRPQPGADAWHR